MTIGKESLLETARRCLSPPVATKRPPGRRAGATPLRVAVLRFVAHRSPGYGYKKTTESVLCLLRTSAANPASRRA